MSELANHGDQLLSNVGAYVSEAVNREAALQTEVDRLNRSVTPDYDLQYGMTLPSNGDPTAIEGRLKNTLTGTRKFYSAVESDMAAVLGKIKQDGQAGRGYTTISFKPPIPWAGVAKGEMDTFLLSMKDRIQRAGDQFAVNIDLGFAHEPENDSGITDAKRDDWRNMQEHCGEIFDTENIDYGCILMGYHSMPSVAAQEGNRWLLENCVPGNAKFVFMDYYEKRGRNKKGTSTEQTDRTNFPAVFKVMQDFCEPRGMRHGLAETGICKRGFDAIPNWYDHVLFCGVFYGASTFLQFNTNQNDSQPGELTGWTMDATREKAYALSLERVHQHNGR